MKLLFLILSLILPQAAMAQEEYDRKFYCSAQDRFLSDEDFARLALGYELEKMRGGYRHDLALPEGYEIGSVDEFLERNPDSYDIVRDPKNMRYPGTSWFGKLEDWLDGEQIAIWILIPSNTVGEPMLSLTYFTDECGELNMDRSYQISNFHFTE